MDGDFLHAALLAFVISAFAVQLFLYLHYYRRPAKITPSGGEASQPPVTVLIAARNEAANLRQNLPFVFAQDYPQYQVVVVNDSSWDQTAEVLEEFKQTNPNLHIATVSENSHFDGGKKFALTLGIKAAKYDRLLLTDADCRPHPGWIAAMVRHIPGPEGLVLGYSPVKKAGSGVNLMARYDNFFTAVQYLGMALAGNPYMGVGRNLSYSRDFFMSSGGFKRHYLLPSGDDDLFVNEHAQKLQVAVSLEPESHVETDGPKSWKTFWKQKRRHLTTGRRYRRKDKFRLLLYPLSLLILLAGSIVLLLANYKTDLLIGLLAVRLIVQIYIFRRSMQVLGQKDLIWFAPVLDVFYLLFGMLLQGANLLTKQPKWKK